MDNSIWFLKKHDEDEIVFGPADLESLRDWAMAAKISPMDWVSNDNQKTWERAPMVDQLHMDWLVEVSNDFLYGPTTIGTVQEFLANGEITGNTTVINSRDNSRCRIRDNAVFRGAPRKNPRPMTPMQRAGSAHDLTGLSATEVQKKVLELEMMILQLKRRLEEMQRRHHVLRDKYVRATGVEP
ncbi:MAG: hypothetical protein ACC661_07235 [Verrucomicrobiales bacterium]